MSGQGRPHVVSPPSRRWGRGPQRRLMGPGMSALGGGGGAPETTGAAPRPPASQGGGGACHRPITQAMGCPHTRSKVVSVGAVPSHWPYRGPAGLAIPQPRPMTTVGTWLSKKVFRGST